MHFDVSKKYQIGLVFGPMTGAQISVSDLPKIISRDSTNSDVSLRLRARTDQKRMLVVDGIPQPLDSVVWTGPKVWTLEWSPMRLDLTVDALTYEDLSEKSMSVHTIIDRAGDNFAQLVKELGVNAKRLVCIAEMRASTNECPDPTSYVADRFLSSSYASRHGLLDVSARINHTHQLSMTDAGDMDLNRISEAQATWSHNPSVGVTRELYVKFDCNTTPIFDGKFTDDDVREFLQHARSWIGEEEERATNAP